MTTKTTYALHEYNHSFDASLAQMWNESDNQWPGTFNEGVPQTEERVAEWMDRVEAIIKFVAVKNDSGEDTDGGFTAGKVVGYGDLWEDMGRPRSAYVALLNVHPEHQGRSLARRMLTGMVDWAVENDYDRITIDTWPANIKAMPLYKKVGFFWDPDTNVHMENYVPAVRLLPAAQDYFARHDWYCTYDRELKQVEDDMRHPCTGDMNVYILRWEADGDVIEAVFDRKAQALTGLETNRWAAYLRVGEGEPAQGVSYPMEWEFANKNPHPITVTVSAAADEGIELDYQTSLTLQPGEHKVVAAAYRVAADAPKFQIDNRHIPTPKVKSTLTIDGESLEFAAGLRYRPAVEFSLHPEVVSLLPGMPQTTHLQLHNRVKHPLTGTARLGLPDGLTTDWQTREFSADAEGYTGIPVTLTAKKSGYHRLNASVAFRDSGQSVATKPKHLPVTAIAPGGWAAGEGDEELILENDYFRITCKAKGGAAKIWNKVTQRNQARLDEEIGPPFTPANLHEQTYDLHLQPVEGDTGGARAAMTARSTRFPGLVVGREISLNASPLLKVRHWITNNGEETKTDLQLRPRVQLPRIESHHVTIPLRERIVREHASQFGNARGDLPEKPERYAEEWAAYEQSGHALGLIWPETGVEQIQSWWDSRFFYLTVPALEPGATVHLSPLYLYAGPGDWRTVRQTWRRLRDLAHTRIPDAPLAKAKQHFEIGFSPSPLLTIDDEITAELTASTTREYKLTGKITIHPPPGWVTEPDQAAISGVDHKSPATETVTLRAAAPRVGAVSGQLRLQTPAFDASRPFTILRLGERTSPVQVSTSQKSGYKIWRIANGRTEWEIAPAFSGCVIGWREKGRDTNHLHTSFPDDGELSWMKPWFGGIRPILHNPEKRGWPGKLHDETFTGSPLEAPGPRGLPWQGLRLTTGLTRDIFRGLRAEITYLTLPGSNLLKVVYRLVNETSVYRDAEPGVMAYFQVDGAPENGVLHTGEYHRKRTPHTAWMLAGHWAAVENPDTGRAAVVVNATGWQRVQAIDWGDDGGHFNVYEVTRVPPNGAYQMVVYLGLVESVAEGRLYEALCPLPATP
ncbi:MAG: GNAT family N-acetyltransferase [Anaerolineales bacterium]